MIEFAEALEEVGVATIALKGGAILLDEPPQHSCVMMSDIDLLVSSAKFQKAIKVGSSLGYTTLHSADQHSAVLRHPEHIAMIDLHVDLGPQRHVLAADEALARAGRLSNSPLWQLSPTDRAIHNIYHAQIQNRNFQLAILSLHQLCNLGLLIEYCGSRIDWGFVRSRLEEQGYRSAFLAYLYTGQQLLGINVPTDIVFGRPQRLHYRRIMLQLDWRWLHNLVTYPAILTSGLTEDRVGYRRAKGLPIQGSAAALMKFAIRALRRHRFSVLTKLVEVHKTRFGPH
jgi:hypothetical protein